MRGGVDRMRGRGKQGEADRIQGGVDKMRGQGQQDEGAGSA